MSHKFIIHNVKCLLLCIPDKYEYTTLQQDFCDIFPIDFVPLIFFSPVCLFSCTIVKIRIIRIVTISVNPVF